MATLLGNACINSLIDYILISFVSDHGISGMTPFEVSINRNEWTSRKQLRAVHSFLLMDTSKGVLLHIRLLHVTHR